MLQGCKWHLVPLLRGWCVEARLLGLVAGDHVQEQCPRQIPAYLIIVDLGNSAQDVFRWTRNRSTVDSITNGEQAGYCAEQSLRHT